MNETTAANDSHEQMVHFDGGDIHVRTSGAPTTTAVLLLHGLAGSTAWWDPVLPALHDLYVVRIDLLGHGDSAKPHSGYDIAEQARRVGLVLDVLGVRAATVFGHSTGGYVATSLATQRRDLVTAIALINTGPRPDAFLDNGTVGNLLSVPAIGRRLWPLLPAAAFRRAMSTAVTLDVRIPEQMVTDAQGMTYHSFTAASAASQAFLRERPLPDRLAELDLPTMVIFGNRDRRWQPASVEDYRRIPQVRIETPDCGHSPMLELPDLTAALIGDFVRRQ